MDSWYTRGRSWSCFKGHCHCSFNRTFCRQEWEHTTYSIDSVWEREKGGNEGEGKRKERLGGTERGRTECTVASYGKPFIYWVWEVQSSNLEFNCHYYFLSQVTSVLLGAGVICCDVSEGWWGWGLRASWEKQFSRVALATCSTTNCSHIHFFSLFLSTCAKGYQNTFIRTLK